MILKRFFQSPVFRRPLPPERAVYEAIVAAARHPKLYAGMGIPDTVDGRFDMIVLHAFLVLDRLKGVEAPFRQNLVDELFRDMDRSLREMGVGDLSVGKKVRKMAEAFYGRIAAYDKAIDGKGTELALALGRNVWPEAEQPRNAAELAGYATSQREFLRNQNPSEIAAGRIVFKEPSP
jgi:cytochrome b pre-mRNA-processing protein 3